MEKEAKIAALTKLMTDGILTADEFTRLIAALDGNVNVPQREPEKTPAQRTYENYITEKVAPFFKSPASVKFPPFDPSMVKQGVIKLDLKDQNVRYIETYVDAPNSYGTMLREQIIIGIDNDFNPLFWAEHLQLGTLLGKSKSWTTMSKNK